MVSPTGSQHSLTGSHHSLDGSQSSSLQASSSTLCRTKSLPNLSKSETVEEASQVKGANSWPQMSIKQRSSLSLSSSFEDLLEGRSDSSSPWDSSKPTTKIRLLDCSWYFGPHGEDAQNYDTQPAFDNWVQTQALSEADVRQMDEDFGNVGNPLVAGLMSGDIRYTGQTTPGKHMPDGIYEVQLGQKPTFVARFRTEGGVGYFHYAMQKGFMQQYGPELGKELYDIWENKNNAESELLWRQDECSDAEEICGKFGDPDGAHYDPEMLEFAQQVLLQKQTRIAELEQSIADDRGKLTALVPV